VRSSGGRASTDPKPHFPFRGKRDPEVLQHLGIFTPSAARSSAGEPRRPFGTLGRTMDMQHWVHPDKGTKIEYLFLREGETGLDGFYSLPESINYSFGWSGSENYPNTDRG